ncbi:hypothetical protein [Desulfoluna butyratoxydans]|uniref:Uncharacterized protein n=1 Tax=Desulfoluna butyratoxydans TaxID=231438 RepID=A0A4U8YP56_9BACT|nr:hypothetical protein [Desulfoluna butyratoxydans]VFQ45956.1 hypothetical protein MSL71_36190 [Desulfoluna butyratoxydans]
MPINGNTYDWESVTIDLNGTTAIDIEEISYNDSREIDLVYGKGSISTKYGRKNYSASGSMSLLREEFQRLRKKLGGSVYKGEPFPISVSYGDEGMDTVTDTLPKVKITKQDTSAKQDESATGKVKLDFKILSPIKWGGDAAL